MDIRFRQGFSFEDVLRSAWSIFTKDPAPFIALPFIVNIPYLLISIYAYLYGEDKEVIDMVRNVGIESLYFLIPVLAVGTILFILFSLLVVIIVTYLVHDMIHEKETNMIDIMKRSVRRLFPYLATEILKVLIILGVVVLGGIPIIGLSLIGDTIGAVFAVLYVITLVIGFMSVGVYWFFTPYIVAVRDTWAIDALRRSYSMVKGKWWKVFGYLILFGFMLAIPLWIIMGLVYWRVGDEVISNLIIMSAQIIVNAFGYVFYVVFFLYLDYEYTHHAREKTEKRETEEEKVHE